MYFLTVYTYINCPHTSCDKDLIIVKMKDEGINFKEIFRRGLTNDETKDKQWVRSQIGFEAATTDIYVNILVAIRTFFLILNL
jgi:hypothetical protein